MRSVRNRPRFDHVLCLATILVACAQSGPVALTGLGATDTAGGSGGQSDTELGGETSAESGGSNANGGSSARITQGGTTSDTGKASGGSTAKGGSSSAATGGSKAATGATGGRTSGGATAQTGGAATLGGAVATGGNATSSNGSNNGTGGGVATGGTRATGGAVATGGAPASGGGETTSPVIGAFPCSASNSTPAATDMPFAVTVDSCFSWTKPATGVLKVGNWSGGSVTVQIADSTGAVFSDKTVPSGDWTSISGVAAGAVFINVTAVAAGSSAQIKLNAF